VDAEVEQPFQPVLAIDLGGTQIRTAVITPDHAVHARRAVLTQDQEGVDAVVGRICDLAAQTRDAAQADGLPAAIGIGISSPGPLNPWRGLVVAPPNLRGWRDVPLADRVAESLDLPAFLERDTNVAVKAEWHYGAARGTQHAIYVTISTGIGGGIIVDGRPLLGPDGTAGEVGHITVELDGPLCGDGKPGHAEAIGAGAGIAREARALLERGGSERLAALAAEGERVDAALVARAADEGDEACRAILDRAWSAIGAMCASLVNVLNPEVIVLGGSIAEHRPRVRETVKQEIERRAFATPAKRVRIEMAALGDDVSLIGSLPIVNERIGDPAYRREPADRLSSAHRGGANAP
jgi:glucokinase